MMHTIRKLLEWLALYHHARRGLRDALDDMAPIVLLISMFCCGLFLVLFVL